MGGLELAIVVMLCFGVGSAFWKIPAQAVGPVRAVYYRQLFVTNLLGLVLLFVPKPVGCTVPDLLIAILIALFGYLPLYFFLRAISRGVVGVVSGIANAKVLITILLGHLFLGDAITVQQWLLIAILVSALFGLAWQPPVLGQASIRLAAGSLDAFIACVLWGVVYFVIAFPVAKFGPYYFAFLLELGVLCASMFHLRIGGIPASVLPPQAYRPLLVCVLTAVVGTLSYNLAISRASISLVAAISFSSPVIATLTAAIAFRERLGPRQLGSMVVIVVVLTLLTLSKQ